MQLELWWWFLNHRLAHQHPTNRNRGGRGGRGRRERERWEREVRGREWEGERWRARGRGRGEEREGGEGGERGGERERGEGKEKERGERTGRGGDRGGDGRERDGMGDEWDREGRERGRKERAIELTYQCISRALMNLAISIACLIPDSMGGFRPDQLSFSLSGDTCLEVRKRVSLYKGSNKTIYSISLLKQQQMEH